MSSLTTTYRLNGEEIELESRRAWEATANHLEATYNLLEELPIGVVPEVLRERVSASREALSEARSLAMAIANATGRFERVGHPRPLEAALADARFAGRL